LIEEGKVIEGEILLAGEKLEQGGERERETGLNEPEERSQLFFLVWHGLGKKNIVKYAN
jgi:hypothetical protein